MCGQGWVFMMDQNWCSPSAEYAVNCKNYINADLIAQGLSPFEPELAVVQAGKLMLFEIKKCVNSNVTFAFETTLSGRGYEKKSSSGKISVMK